MANAVKKDQNGEYKEAIKLYCESLGHFIPAIHCIYPSCTHLSKFKERKHINMINISDIRLREIKSEIILISRIKN